MHRHLAPAFLLASSLFASTMRAAPPEFMPLFPNGVPDVKQSLPPETDTTTKKDALIMGRPVIRLGNVTEPALAFYPAPASHNSGATVLVFPGGGYQILALDLEGSEICEWLNSIGVNAALVKYRVPEPKNIPRYEEPLADATQAMSYLRSKAQDWQLDPNRIGVLGFSAGGHLAVMASNSPDHPAFAIIIYPGYLATGARLETLAPEIKVTAATPPSFLVQTEDDPVHVENSLVYYRALKEAKVPAEIHLFSVGGHGYGMRPDPQKPVTQWPALAEAWLKSRKLIQ